MNQEIQYKRRSTWSYPDDDFENTQSTTLPFPNLPAHPCINYAQESDTSSQSIYTASYHNDNEQSQFDYLNFPQSNQGNCFRNGIRYESYDGNLEMTQSYSRSSSGYPRSQVGYKNGWNRGEGEKKYHQKILYEKNVELINICAKNSELSLEIANLKDHLSCIQSVIVSRENQIGQNYDILKAFEQKCSQIEKESLNNSNSNTKLFMDTKESLQNVTSLLEQGQAQINRLQQCCFLKNKIMEFEESRKCKNDEIEYLKTLQKEIDNKIESDKESTLKQLQWKQESIGRLEQRQEKLGECLKKWKQKRFELNQKYCKQERLSKDLDDEIEKLNEQIQKQVKFDQKLRLEIVNKMQVFEFSQETEQKEEMLYEKIRKIKQQIHISKMDEMEMTKIIDKNDQQITRMVQPQNAQIVKHQIIELTSLLQKCQTAQKQGQQELIVISNENQLKKKQLQEKQKLSKKESDKMDELIIGSEWKESQLREKVKGFKNEIKVLEKKKKQLKLKQQSQVHSHKLTKANDKFKFNIKLQNLDYKQQSKHKGNVKHKKLKAHQQLYSSNEDCFYVKRPLNKFHTSISITLLMGLLLLSYFYNRIRVWFLIHN